MAVRILCIVIGYLFGAIIQGGYWLGKLNHIDIREHGSGNAGTTNVMRTLGKKAGIITYILDAVKPIVSALVCMAVAGKNFDSTIVLFMYSGIGVVLGHNFPFYLKFKGGKGIAASSGVVISLLLFPKYCFIFTVTGLLTFAVVTLVTKYVSLGSLIAITVWFLEMVLWALIGWLPVNDTQAAIEVIGIVFIITALAYIRHAGNISRLVEGTERKIGQKKQGA